MKWYKRDPDAALAGMIELTLEECGAYNIVIDLLYSRNGNLPADDHFFARACKCRPQVWRRVRDALIAKGKLHYKTDGKLTANRVETELQTASKLMANLSCLGVVSAENRNKNKAGTPTARWLHPHPHPHPDKKDKKEKVHFKNGNGSKRIEKQKPKHCQKSKNGRIWCDVGTMEFTAYAEDYSQAHLGEAPKLDWNGTGAWFNLSGEPR